jgi:ATP-dependent helicase HrpB
MQTDLPVYALRDDLRRAWASGRNLVICAPTGSGKTTQVCQYLLADGAANGKRIIVLQPRRVAARSVARRVAQEMDVEVGSLVGYQVRFDERLSAETQIAFVTEGILLRWLQSDPDLSSIGAILFDEFHERNLLSDTALALCKQLQQTTRPDLLLCVMSATLEVKPVAEYLHNAPVIESEGRSFPVEINYEIGADIIEGAAQRAVKILRETTEGDVLVFMPGMQEIIHCMDETRRLWRNTASASAIPPVMLPLHGEMSPADQDRVFASSDYRRVIVATNVAETSITIPGVRFVVDSGLARIARYDPARGVNTLHLEPISRASADQRAGRAGRIAPGVCWRMWQEQEMNFRPARNTPEIQRTELSSALLLLHAQGVQDVAHFDFLDKPDLARIQAAEELLESLGAIHKKQITEIGLRMLRIPTHPRYARMLIEAQKFDVVRHVALMAALVSGRDLLIRLKREDKIQRRNRESLIQRGQHVSDYFLLANSFEHAVKNKFDAKACYAFGVNPHVAREVAQAYEQLIEVCTEVGLLDASTHSVIADNEAIQRCHLVGFLDHLAVRVGASDEYDLSGGRRCALMEESIVGRNVLIVASEMREITTRSGDKLSLLGFASAVKPAWVRELNPSGLNEKVEHVYDRLNRKVVAGRVVRYHDLLIGGEPVSELDPDACALVLAEEFADQLNKLPQWAQIKPLLAAHPIPREQVVSALARAWHGCASVAEAAKRDVVAELSRSMHSN